MLQLIKNIQTELEKRFSKNGEFRKRITILKELKKTYPEDETIKKMLQIFRQKIYGIKGANFIYDEVANLFESRFPFQNGIIEIENIKFDLTSLFARNVFYNELTDLFLSDDYFKKSKEHEVFYEIIKEYQFFGEGPYQYHSVYLKPKDVIVDVGANMGMFSLFANKFYDCKCYAFEPVKSTIDLLKKNIALNQMERSIDLVPYALNDKECDIEIQIDQNNIGASSFIQDIEKCIGLEKIHCITLDKWANENQISKIDFVKADIEGAERNMLLGATEVLQKFAPKLAICTYHLPDDPQVLEDIILKANPKYKVKHAYRKLYAQV